jgi:hypothetical protein
MCVTGSKRTARTAISVKVAIWCAMGTSVLWAHFYLKMITARALQFLLSVTSRFCCLPASTGTSTWCTYQQDGDAAHTAGRSAEVVRSLFHCVISRFGDIQRPVLGRSLRSQVSFCGATRRNVFAVFTLTHLTSWIVILGSNHELCCVEI